MCVKFSITVCGVSSFMDSSAGICDWHMCEKDTEYSNRFGLPRVNKQKKHQDNMRLTVVK